ncbi:transporter substrate-binding domain-containing protein [Agaribacter marinus]|uniref:Transporter substrate-binding domain-containing protein n=1 Tax=Virgibacillus salarius TaxID=447199 RepID=A0A941DQQ4_9BACI|nr:MULTISPECIES: transporter substrate-binding domain-containing protein [Bacillaceae]MBR7795234.1 transporter substrate-binding domain-containing protein [Virgibacillus salarius]NAZ07950.1 transporter substrate-binding domain-containing protein [Agaribacter marinus]WBX80378.1 transporter substrate-binding domain-containing protein [Virgibacillus salarius]
MSRFRLVLSLFILIAILAACGKSDENNNSEGEKGVTDKRWEDIQEAGELVVGTSGTLIAASYYDGDEEKQEQLTGYDVEVMREVANRLNLNISFEIMGIDSMLPAVKSGRIDVAANDIETTDKRKEEFNFSDPYKYSYSTMVVRKEDNSGIESLEDLKGKKAGGGATTIYSQIAEHFGAEVVTYGNAPNEAYLRDVHNGRTDVIVNDYYLSKFGVAGFPDFDIHLHPDLKFHPTEQAVVIPEGADKLTEEINKALTEMREDGTLTELAKKFYKEDASQKPEGEIKEIDGLDL